MTSTHDHISWASRGYRDADVPALQSGGWTPVSAPGALHDHRFSDVFRSRGGGTWSVVGLLSENREPAVTVLHAVRHLGVPVEEHVNLFSPYLERTSFLGGSVTYFAADYGFFGPPTLQVSGHAALRLLCYRLGIRQPRRLLDETRVPSIDDLETQFAEELTSSECTDGTC